MSGLPLLSHPPPDNGQDAHACRKCNKDFNMLFNRQRRCNHCGPSWHPEIVNVDDIADIQDMLIALVAPTSKP